MRNVFGLQMETKIVFLIILIVVIIFLITVFKSSDKFNDYMDDFDKRTEQIRGEMSK